MNMATPFSNLQPSFAIDMITLTLGIFPSAGNGSASGDTLGFIYDFAGSFAPSGSVLAAGQTLSTSTNSALFATFGNTYGGNGTTTFALPNLNGRAVIGAGGGQSLGANVGTATVTLTSAELPPPQSSGQPFDNLQPSTPLQTLIATSGIFPSSGGGGGAAAFVGELADFAGSFVPSGWTVAAGQLLSIASNTALFSILGTTYGGDGTTDFALPNLQGSVAVGADAAHPVGSAYGQASTKLTTAELPPNGVPVNNDQPSVAVEYLIATSGIFPSSGSGSSFSNQTETLGQIVAFAGTFVPSGYALADGQLLNINTNEALFSVFGTAYGGDGQTTFALPNLSGRTAIGADGSDATLGVAYGADSVTLNANNIPPACYCPGTLILTGGGLCAVEALAIGDIVITASGQRRPIKWIGRRSYVGRLLAANPGVQPIRFRAGSLGGGLPRRDLVVSPEHAMFLDGVLIPARYLVNGSTIVQQRGLTRVDYFHVELDSHDVLLAEGAAAESFLDDDSRSMFHNASEFAKLYPGVPTPGTFCAPKVDGGYRMEAVRRRLAVVAGTLPLAA